MVKRQSIKRVVISALLAGGLSVTAAPSRAAPLSLPVLGWSHTKASLKKAARKPPKDPQKALKLAHTLRRAGLFPEAIRVLQRASYARGARAHQADIRLAWARTHLAADNYKAAVLHCKRIQRPKVKRHVCLTEAYLLWKRATLAVPEAEKAIAADGSSYEAHVAHGLALLQGGKPKKAQAALARALEITSTRHEAQLALARVHLRERDDDKALQALRAAHRADGEVPEVLVLLAATLEPTVEGERLLRLALKIRPDMGDAHAHLGRVQLARGKHADAEKALRAALKQQPKNATWMVWLGKVLLARGQPQKALKQARGAQKLVKNDGEAKLLEADSLAAQGDIDLAIEAYELAYGYSRTDPAALVNAAKACLRGKRPTTGRAFADRAVQEFPKWGPAWEIAGDIAVAQKDKQAARSAYRKALRGAGPVDKAAVKRKLKAL